MPEQAKQTTKERLKDITDSIEKGIQELFQSDKYKQYLTTMSRFHKYSVNNQMLIYLQKPNATHVAGFNKWHDQFGRNVMKGEKGIKIIAPTPFKKKIEEEKLDPDTKLPVLDKDGNPVIVEKEISIPMFKPVTVFDVSQTQGRPLPQLASDLHGNVQNFDVFMEALKRSAPVPISIEPMAVNLDGFFDSSNQSIHVREGMSEVQTVSAAVHEVAHSKLHNYKRNELLDSRGDYQSIEILGHNGVFTNGRIDRSKLPDGLYCYDLRGSDNDPGQFMFLESSVMVNHAGSVITAEPIELPENGRIDISEKMSFDGGDLTLREFYESAFPDKARKSRNTEEVEAESISFAVCAYYGIATGENSFGYIASWSKDKELKELRASLETINKTSSDLITDIDRNYADIMKERGLDKEHEESEVSDQPTNIKEAVEPSTNTPPQPTTETVAVFEGEKNNLPFDVVIQTLHIPDPEPEKAADPVDIPDPAISIESMNAFGYADADMLPLTKERALELMEHDVTVYLLYGDNTEAMAFDREEIIQHDGIFGITREDWDAVKDDFRPRDFEKEFADNPGDSYVIYQLRQDASTAELRFMGTEYLEKQGLEVSRENYAAVYAGALPDGSTNDRLNSLYETFNIAHPEDFKGHSLSVSDIIAMRQAGKVSCHYVDPFGFKEIPGFFPPENYLKNAEMAVEDDYGMIDGIVNNGAKQKEPEKEPDKKPSVLEKLHRPQPERKPKTAAPGRGAEMEM